MVHMLLASCHMVMLPELWCLCRRSKVVSSGRTVPQQQWFDDLEYWGWPLYPIMIRHIMIRIMMRMP